MEMYRLAGNVANFCILYTLDLVVVDALISDICVQSDEFCASELNKLPHHTGFTLPTCISVNNIIQNYSPRVIKNQSDALNVRLKDGDVVKVEIGVHVDGHLCQVGHTKIIGLDQSSALFGVAAAAEMIKRVLKANQTSMYLAQIILEQSKIHNCVVVPGVDSMMVDRYIPCKGNVLNLEKVLDFEFKEGEVYVISVCFAPHQNIEGCVARQCGDTWLYSRSLQPKSLRLESAKQLSSSLNYFPFHVALLPPKLKLGASEMIRNEALKHHVVMKIEKQRKAAIVTFTCMILKDGIHVF